MNNPCKNCNHQYVGCKYVCNELALADKSHRLHKFAQETEKQREVNIIKEMHLKNLVAKQLAHEEAVERAKRRWLAEKQKKIDEQAAAREISLEKRRLRHIKVCKEYFRKKREEKLFRMHDLPKEEQAV